MDIRSRSPFLVLAAIIAFGVSSTSAFAWTSTWLAGGHSTSGVRTANYTSIAPKVGGALSWGKPYDFELGWKIDASVMIPKDEKGPDMSGVIGFVGGTARKHFLASDPNGSDSPRASVIASTRSVVASSTASI